MDKWTSVLDYGMPTGRNAVGTAQLQRAIDELHARGGGTLYFPAGDYCTGSIELKSNICLHLDSGAVLWASRNTEDFRIDRPDSDSENGALISATNARHIAITGTGIINGGYPEELAVREGGSYRPAFRWKTIRLHDCSYVQITGVTLLDMEGWTIGLRRCDSVCIDNLTIHSNYYRTNTDGIQIGACRDVRVSNCALRTGDDSIVLFSSRQQACERITITNCTMESSASGIKIGGFHQNFRDITVSNCVMRNCMVGIGFYTKGDGTVERVLFENLTIGTIDDPGQVNDGIANQIVPIFMDIDAWHHVPGTAKVRDVSFRGIVIDSEFGILVQGMDDNAIAHLTFRDITFRVRRKGDYSRRRKPSGFLDDTPQSPSKRTDIYARMPSYITIANVQRLFMDHVEVIVPEEVATELPRAAISLHRVRGATIRSVLQLPEQAAGDPVLTDEQCQGIRIME